MSGIVRSALALVWIAGLAAAAQAQPTMHRYQTRTGEVLYSGRSAYVAPASPREDQIVMGLRVPGSGPSAAPTWPSGY